MSKKTNEFDAVIIKKTDIDAAYVEFPLETVPEFGKERVNVNAWFDGY
jgi:hypothetical protein